MEIVHFLGHVEPQTVQVSIGHAPLIKWEAPEHNLSMEFTTHIAASKIDVECKVNRYGPELLVELRLRALDLCRASVNLVAMKMGFGLTTILDRFVDPSGAIMAIHVHNSDLAALCTAFDLTTNFDAVHLLVLQDVRLSVILNDMISGLTTTHTAQISCARVLDGLKHHIASAGTPDSVAWQQMRDALNVSEKYLKFVTEHSREPRHGKLPIISENDQREILRRTWIVMNRYLEHLKMGNAALPLADFPLLT